MKSKGILIVKSTTSLVVTMLAFAMSAQASLPTLNTGVSTGGGLPLGTNALEQNYSVFYSASLVSNPATTATPWHAITSPPVGGWIANPGNAVWISPISQVDLNAGNFNPLTSDPTGFFYFTQVSSFNGEFRGGFTTDDPGALYINGTFITGDPGWSTLTDQNAYSQLWNFDVTLHQGDNVEWVVYNASGFAPNPAGLLVSGNFVPEPSTIQLVPAGLAILFFRRRVRAV